MKLYPLRPEVSIDKLSFNGLCEMLRSTQSPTLYSHKRYGHHDCDLNTTVVEIVDAATAGATGLDLMEIKHGRVVPKASDIFSL
jgi:hypothetical protein